MPSTTRLRARRPLGVLLAAFLATGCSSFPGDWEEGASRVPPAGDPLAGAWDGRWVSETTGHEGRLRCIAEPAADEEWLLRFRARWGGMFRFSYELPVEATTASDEVLRLAGEADLGWPYGVYAFEAEVAGDRLRASYRTEGDQGTFSLTRVRPEETSEGNGDGSEPSA